MAPRESSGNSMLSSAEEPRSERDVFSAGLSREEWSFCLLVPLSSGYTVLVSHSAHQDPPPLWNKTQVLFQKAVFQTDRPQQALVHGVIPPQVHNFASVFFLTAWCSHQSIFPIPLPRYLWISALSAYQLLASNMSDPIVQILKGHSFDFWEISPVTFCQLAFLLLILPFDPNGKDNFWLTSTQLPIYWVLIWPIPLFW